MESVVNPMTAVILNVLVWGLGYIYVGKVWKGTYTFFLFAIAWGFNLIYIFVVGFEFSLLLEILVGYFLSSIWFGYDAYNMAIKVREKY